ncbi:DUF6894 family protein [Sphingomonas sp. R86520]|uniref:DUF6894 family protein n=1 Tax=Sphingomonas sp. R86520 TaxID=3093859 RepID=UPI0036D3AB21
MARFFFHLNERGKVTQDDEGRELADRSAAYKAAIVDARSIMAADLLGGSICLGSHIDIMTSEGERVQKVSFKNAVIIDA